MCRTLRLRPSQPACTDVVCLSGRVLTSEQYCTLRYCDCRTEWYSTVAVASAYCKMLCDLAGLLNQVTPATRLSYAVLPHAVTAKCAVSVFEPASCSVGLGPES